MLHVNATFVMPHDPNLPRLCIKSVFLAVSITNNLCLTCAGRHSGQDSGQLCSAVGAAPGAGPVSRLAAGAEESSGMDHDLRSHPA